MWHYFPLLKRIIMKIIMWTCLSKCIIAYQTLGQVQCFPLKNEAYLLLTVSNILPLLYLE